MIIFRLRRDSGPLGGGRPRYSGRDRPIATNATHRNRAINTLTGLALVFMRCTLVLMGSQSQRAVGAELLAVCGLSAVVFGRGYVKAIRLSDDLKVARIAQGSVIHLSEMTGAVIFLCGPIAGLYVAAVAMVVNVCYMVTAAWLLIMGVFATA